MWSEPDVWHYYQFPYFVTDEMKEREGWTFGPDGVWHLLMPVYTMVDSSNATKP